MNYNDAIEESFTIVSGLGSSFVPVASKAVLNSDDSQIESILNAINQNLIVESVELIDNKGKNIHFESYTQPTFLNSVLPDLEKQNFKLWATTPDGGKINVGTLIIHPGKEILSQKISSGFYISFLNLFTGLLAIIASAAFICRRTLTIPLNKLAASIAKTDPAKDVVLQEMDETGLTEEIENVCDKINELLQKEHQIQVTEKRLRSSLEQMVRSRTAAQELTSAKLDKIINTDTLSGLCNRIAFDNQLQQDWNSAQRSGTPLALLMIDIDNFNKYNDNYGHKAGDECISTTAGVIESSLPKSSDTAARFSENKFAVILPHTDIEESQDIATTICEKLAEQRIAHFYSATGHVTISVGISERITQEHESPQHLIHAADKALLRSKSEGKNRISIAAPENYS
ncbi:GGDEF domain-containing protein [Maridesulfovibrio sp.]|uniref:GGDEF domain-containing protein n=1 Tax=Maridesulfovibrio sp. TaxID=2795000 RepID=UPI0039EE8FA7